MASSRGFSQIVDGPELVARARRSMIDLEAQGREVVRIRMHPLDWETLVAHYMPSLAGKGDKLAALFGAGVDLDDTCLMGQPVALWEPEAESGL